MKTKDEETMINTLRFILTLIKVNGLEKNDKGK